MKSNIIKKIFFFAFLILCTASLTNAQSMQKSKTMKKDTTMKMDKSMKTGKSMKMDMMSAKTKVDSSIIRKGVIDLKSIDKNKDGYVYEGMMDYNVISDKPGKCPICGMTLKKVSLKQCKANLIKAGYKVKN